MHAATNSGSNKKAHATTLIQVTWSASFNHAKRAANTSSECRAAPATAQTASKSKENVHPLLGLDSVVGFVATAWRPESSRSRLELLRPVQVDQLFADASSTHGTAAQRSQKASGGLLAQAVTLARR